MILGVYCYILIFKLLAYNFQTVQPENDGRALYIKYCLTCHQTNGGGVPQMYPPLEKSTWVNGDKNRLIGVLLKGLNGEIEVNEEIYDQTMPKFDYLTDDQISKILTYVSGNFENKATLITPEEVSEIRKSK